MKEKVVPILVLLVLVLLFAAPYIVPPVQQIQATANVEGVTVMESTPFDVVAFLLAAVQLILGSATIGTAVTFLVGVLKQAGFIADGVAAAFVSGFNFLLIFGVFLIKVFMPSFDLGILDKIASAVVTQGPALILVLMPILVWISKLVYSHVKGVVPVVGYTYSPQA